MAGVAPAATRQRRFVGKQGLTSAGRRPRVLLGHRRMLVPVADNLESEKAIDFASRLAAEHGSSIVAVAAIEVPPMLPLDAHMIDEESAARRLLDRANAVAELYGVGVSPRIMRARDAASAIVDQVVANDIELVVIGAPRKIRASKSVAMFGSTVEHVLKKAPCRVMVIAATTTAAARRDTQPVAILSGT